jgi:hypothetical protein
MNGVRAAILLTTLLGCCVPAWAEAGVAPYGAKVAFQQDRPIQFRDFALIYLGERRVGSKVYPRGFLYYDFRVVSGSEKAEVSWTSGTGVIEPQRFVVNGRAFLLELRLSESLGRLAPNELVVTPEHAKP